MCADKVMKIFKIYIDFLTYFSSKGRMTHEVMVVLTESCATVLSEYVIYIAGKSTATIYFIITQLLKLEWGEKLM